jgi:glucosamine--fructose-6-phosphate aminotransferase (isomerizing)
MRDPFLAEIASQPDALGAAAAAVRGQRETLLELRRLAADAGPLVLTGMGSSYDACLGAASALGARDVLAVTVNSAELVRFRLGAVPAEAVIVAVSQSGRSAELVRLAQALSERRLRPRLVSVTNGLRNPLAEAADVALDMGSGREHGPSTRTFAATLVVLDAVVRALDPRRPEVLAPPAAVERAVEASAQLLRDPEAAAAKLGRWHDGSRALVALGRGTARAAAEVSALVIKESAAALAEALDCADFRHGPLEVAGPALACLVLVTEPSALELDCGLAAELASAGASVRLVAPERVRLPGVECVVTGRLEPLLAAAVCAHPAQLLAWQLAVDSGRQPGHLLRASKVTTRE